MGSSSPSPGIAFKVARLRWVGSWTWVRRLIAVDMVAVLAIGGMYLLDASLAPAAVRAYNQQLHATRAALREASAQGATRQDLAPIQDRLRQIVATPGPAWLPNRELRYDQRASSLQQLRSDLAGNLHELALIERGNIGHSLTGARSSIAQDQRLGVDSVTMQALTTRLTELTGRNKTARTIGQLRQLDADSQQLATSATTAGIAQRHENSAIQQAANALSVQTSGDVNAMRAQGNASLTAGRNDATVAAYEAKAGRFPMIGLLMASYDRMETSAPRMTSSVPSEVALGAAAMQRYNDQIHQLLMQGLGHKHVIVSFKDQHVWAYEDGQLQMDSPVTTGIRGVTDYGTDFGPMKIVLRSHPWTMVSPWPAGSALYYPPTVVQWTAFFTHSGESFHDASWEPDSELGPGSQFNASTQSHGCIHLPYAKAEWMFNWTELGTPVDVYPGNGQPVAEQLSEITTDDQGNPRVP